MGRSLVAEEQRYSIPPFPPSPRATPTSYRHRSAREITAPPISGSQDVREEVFEARVFGMLEHLAGRAVLDDASLVHEDEMASNLPGERHLVSHHNHRHALV